MLTARDSVADIVRGLDVGADDYLAKPFSFEVLAARLRGDCSSNQCGAILCSAGFRPHAEYGGTRSPSGKKGPCVNPNGVRYSGAPDAPGRPRRIPRRSD